MSQHSSLRIDPTRTKHRNVLKRHERIHRLMELEKWGTRTSVFGLPKVKSLKIKMKKVKAEKTEGEASAQAPQAPVAAPQAPATDKKKTTGPAEKKAAAPTEKK